VKNRLLKGLALAATLSFAAGVTIVPAQAASEIIVWADETRGPNLEKVFKAKGDWVAGSTIKVVTFSGYDAMGTAFENSTASTGPDILVAGNDWVVKSAKSGKLAPVTLTAAQKSQFTPKQFFDLSYGGKLYGVPVDFNNVSMIYNTKLVKTAPKTYGEMVNYYLANKTKKGLKAGLCIAGGGMSWGGLSGLSALGADPYFMKADGTVDYNKSFDPAVFGKNVKTYLLDKNGKSNGFYPATDTGCQDNFLAGKVPFAVIGNWHWKTFAAAGFAMNMMPVPGVKAGTYGKMFGSVNGAMLTSYAETHGVAVAAKSLLTNFFASTAGQATYEAVEGRPPASKAAQTSPLVLPAQKSFADAGGLSSIPQIGAFLGNESGGASYWASSGAYWTAVLVDGKDPLVEAKKLAAIWKANVAGGKADL
jgi:arabinogalactan oligomer/maltooligosaccharide transport system substrate-binding protein